jgi:hypothetical protein
MENKRVNERARSTATEGKNGAVNGGVNISGDSRQACAVADKGRNGAVNRGVNGSAATPEFLQMG